MLDSSENDFLEDCLKDLRKYHDQNTRSKIDRLNQRYGYISDQDSDRKKSNPSKDTFPHQFKEIQEDFFFLERDFIYRGSLYFLLEKPTLNEPSLNILRDLFIKSANEFSSCIFQQVKDNKLDIQIVFRLTFMYLRIITSISRLSVSQQMPGFSGIQKRSSPSALYYGETNLKSNFDSKRAYSFFRGLLSSIVGSRDIKTFFFIISEFPVSEHLIDLCLDYLDKCLVVEDRGGKGMLTNKREEKIERINDILKRDPEKFQQLQFGLSKGFSISHQRYLKKLKQDLYVLLKTTRQLYDLGLSEIDPLQTKLIILYWLNLIEFPEKTFKSSVAKKMEFFDVITVSTDELSLSKEHLYVAEPGTPPIEVRVKAYSEKSDPIISVPELTPTTKSEDEGERYESKEIPETNPAQNIISFGQSLFNFEPNEHLSFFKVIDKSMYPTFDVGDLLIIKNVIQFQGYDQSYVIEASGSLEIRRIIKTGNLEEDRGVLSPANQEFKEAEISISDLNIRGIVVGVFKSFEEPKN